MDFTVSGAELRESTKSQGSASINIKNNTQAKQQGGIYGTASFGNVLLSGMQINQKKLDENTYNSLLKETEDVKGQIMQSAENAQANLKALFNRLSGADLVKIDEDGFNLNDLSPEEMVGIVDKIKIELAAHGKEVYFANGSVSTQQIEQVVGSAGMAEKVAAGLNEGNLLPTQENVEQLAAGLDKLSELTALDESAKYYLISNNQAPTLDNIYKAQHMQSSKEVSAKAKGAVTVTESEWEQLMPQAADVIRRAGLEADGAQLSQARRLLEADIPITKENILYKAQLDALSIEDLQSGEGLSAFIKNMVQALSEGMNTGDTPLIKKDTAFEQVSDAMRVLWQADIRHVAQVTQSGEPFNIDSLDNAIHSIEAATYRFQFYMGGESTYSQAAAADTAYMQAGIQNQTIQSNYEQLQQVRILMTASAGLFLAKQGVNLHAEPISKLVQQLEDYHAKAADSVLYKEADKALEAKQTAQNMQDKAVNFVSSNAAMGEIVSSFQAVMQVKRAIYEIKHAPDVSMGAVVKEKNENEALTIADFAQKGSEFRQRFEQAGQSYEAVGTEVRRDLGDSVSKAVENSYADILKDLGLENIPSNIDAVRIFAENQMEITKERVENIKEIHSTLKSIIKNMKPETALNMIRENINPMTADIHTVNEYLLEQNENIEADKEEKYSKFLYKLDLTDGITAQEREQFIGIYKMMNIFTKDAGAAIGTLIKQNEDITMANLCKAYNSRRAAGLDYTITDEAKIPEIAEKAGYFNNLFDVTAKHITPLSLKTVNDSKPIASRSVENFCEEVDRAYDEAAEAAYNDKYLEQLNIQSHMESAVVRELSYADQNITVNNVLAMENIMQAGYFNKVFGTDNKKLSMENADSIMQNIDNPEELAKAYEDLEKESEKALNEAVASDTEQNYENINEMRMLNKEIGMLKNLSLRHDYKIPMVTEDGVGMIHLTLIQDSEEKGRISVNLKHKELGNVSVETRVHGDKAELYGISDGDSYRLSDCLESVAAALKERHSMSEVEVNCQDIKTVRRVTYDKAEETTASNVLYGIAKTIVYAMAGKSEN